MSLVVQIVLGLALLVGLIAPFIGNKTWHWTQLMLVVCIILAGTGFLFLAAETVRTHHFLRAKLPKLEKQVSVALRQHEDLLHGAGDTQGVLDLEHQLQMVSRDRGRVWRQVMPAGEVGEDGQVTVEITQPVPHGLAEGAIIFAFEAGGAHTVVPANSEEPASEEESPETTDTPAEEAPAEDAPESAETPPAPENTVVSRQYLGEFRVIEATETGVTLEPVLLVIERTNQRLVESQGPWSLYETMPTDRHSIFAGMTEEELRQLLPAESVEEYIRNGTPATSDDNEIDRVGLDENDQRVGADNLDKAVKFLYDRPLRDYAYLFADLAQKRVLLQASTQAVTEDNARLVTSIEGAKRLGEFRTQQKQLLEADLAGMKKDRQIIESHRDMVSRILANAQQLIDQSLAQNSEMAHQLKEQQLGRIQLINSTAPAPAGVETPAP